MCGEEDGGDVVGKGQSDVGWWRCGGEGRGEVVGEVVRFDEHCEEFSGAFYGEAVAHSANDLDLVEELTQGFISYPAINIFLSVKLLQVRSSS